MDIDGNKLVNMVATERFCASLLVPYRWNRGDFRFPRRLSLCLSVRPSVRPSVCPSVCQSTRCPSTRFSELFSVVLWDIDLKLVPYRWNRGDFRFPRRLSLCLSVRPSVCLSVSLSVHSVSVHSVFRTFLSRPLRYGLEIWYVNLSWHNTDQVRVLSRLTFFNRSYCPLLKFSFPGFSLPSFEILTWNLVYEFVYHNTDQIRVSLRLTIFL